MAEAPARPDSDRNRWLAVAGLVALVALVYAPALANGFIWDDDLYVTNNEALRSPAGLRDIWLRIGTTPQYYPLVYTSFWIEYQLWGLAPAGYHATNVALHALAALLAWRLFARLAVPGAWLAAAVFAVHPVMVESVAWVTERKNVLSLVFTLGLAQTFLGSRQRMRAFVAVDAVVTQRVAGIEYLLDFLDTVALLAFGDVVARENEVVNDR